MPTTQTLELKITISRPTAEEAAEKVWEGVRWQWGKKDLTDPQKAAYLTEEVQCAMKRWDLEKVELDGKEIESEDLAEGIPFGGTELAWFLGLGEGGDEKTLALMLTQP